MSVGKIENEDFEWTGLFIYEASKTYKPFSYFIYRQTKADEHTDISIYLHSLQGFTGRH